MAFKCVEVPATFTLRDSLRGHQAELPDEIIGRLFRMRHVAVHHHDLEIRKSGEPYHEHPLCVEDMVRQLIKKYPVLIAITSLYGEEEQQAACGHDLFETLMTSIDKFVETILDLFKHFSRRTIWLIGALTKWNKDFYWEQLYIANRIDLWVMLIKMLDRLHNLRTIKGFTLIKQTEYLEETLGPMLDLCQRCAEFVRVYHPHIYPVYEDLIRQLRETAEEELQRAIAERDLCLLASS